MAAAPSLISLVPQSGIQFVDLLVDAQALPRLTRAFWEEELPEDPGPDGRPRIALRDRAARRRDAVLRRLPHDLDLITLSIEEGLNLGAALGQAARHGPPGPLRDEWQRALRDVHAGQPRHEALHALAARLALPAVSTLVAALIAAERQGASLAPILRAQAEQRRNERFLRAERLAMEAPVKMLFPLVLCIFPGTFAILLFPVVHQLLSEGVL